jgi:hypothetical protein
MTTTLTAMATLVAVPFLIGVLLAVGLEFSMGRISCGRCALDRHRAVRRFRQFFTIAPAREFVRTALEPSSRPPVTTIQRRTPPS